MVDLTAEFDKRAGYTHYWRMSRDFTSGEWSKIVAAARKIIAAAKTAQPPIGTAGPYHDEDIIAAGGIELAGPMGSGQPVVNNDMIALNGKGPDLDHESFVLTRVREIPDWRDEHFEFCKTARKPYDAVVVSILSAAAKIARDAIDVSSDGGSSAIRRVLGSEQGAPMPHNDPTRSLLADLAQIHACGEFMDDEVESDASARFEEGKPADPTKNMSPADKAKWNKQKEEHADQFRAASERHRLTWDKEAASGLYGYTKQTQRDVEASVRKVQKRALKIARAAYRRDPKVADFLQTHQKRAKSYPAKVLLAALRDLGPKVASDQTSKDAAPTPFGMYGMPSKTAQLGLNACTELRTFAGEVAYGLHSRRQARYAKITGFLKEHSKRARCGYSRMLLSCYPDGPKVAAKKAPPKKDQFTSENNPNPKGNDRDGDGKTNEAKPFKEASSEAPSTVSEWLTYEG
jgi:hypothetical protein